MTCCDPGPGRIAPRHLCSCGSWDVEGWWLALADGHRCLRCRRMWSTEGWELEPRDFWMAFLPAVGARRFLSPAARAAGGAALHPGSRSRPLTVCERRLFGVVQFIVADDDMEEGR